MLKCFKPIPKHFTFAKCFFLRYKDGVAIGPTDYDTHDYNDDETREQLLWYSLNLSDCAVRPDLIFYVCVFTCEAYSVNKEDTVSHNISVNLYYRGGYILTNNKYTSFLLNSQTQFNQPSWKTDSCCQQTTAIEIND